MNRFIVGPTVRNDGAGSGHFNAPRGSRRHVGTDYLCVPTEFVHSPVDGEVTKLGYPYMNEDKTGVDPMWRYVEVTNEAQERHRMYYVKPAAQTGDIVRAGDIIGEAQDITKRYPGQGMKAHVHYEIINKDGDYLDPETYDA